MINNMLKSMKIIFSCILIIVMFTFITIPFTFAGENQNSDLFLPNASVNSYCEKPFHETTEKEIEKLKNVIYYQYLWPIDFYESGSNELNEKRLDVFIRYESDSKTEIFYIIGYDGDCNASEPSNIEIFLRQVIV